MCKHMVDGRGCKGGDASFVKNQILKFRGYNSETKEALLHRRFKFIEVEEQDGGKRGEVADADHR